MGMKKLARAEHTVYRLPLFMGVHWESTAGVGMDRLAAAGSLKMCELTIRGRQTRKDSTQALAISIRDRVGVIIIR